MDETKYEYTNNRNKLIDWLKSNIFSRADNLVKILECGESEHFGFDGNRIFEWYIITDEAYIKFKKIGWFTIKIGELNLFGRTNHGRPLLTDFFFEHDKIKYIIDHND